MGGVSAHNLDATVHVCTPEAGKGFFFARCLIQLRTIILPSMVLIFLFFSCFLLLRFPIF